MDPRTLPATYDILSKRDFLEKVIEKQTNHLKLCTGLVAKLAHPNITKLKSLTVLLSSKIIIITIIFKPTINLFNSHFWSMALWHKTENGRLYWKIE